MHIYANAIFYDYEPLSSFAYVLINLSVIDDKLTNECYHVVQSVDAQKPFPFSKKKTVSLCNRHFPIDYFCERLKSK